MFVKRLGKEAENGLGGGTAGAGRGPTVAMRQPAEARTEPRGW